MDFYRKIFNILIINILIRGFSKKNIKSFIIITFDDVMMYKEVFAYSNGCLFIKGLTSTQANQKMQRVNKVLSYFRNIEIFKYFPPLKVEK